MKTLLYGVGILTFLLAAGYVSAGERPISDCGERIENDGYPMEEHTVITDDSYILTMHRIPYSKKTGPTGDRPVVFLMHGMLSSSSDWVLMGPGKALAYILSDAGYDVWMGNARGNRYSRNNTRLSTLHPYFWRFSWHEIGINDISAMIDHILQTTGETATHYVGHSQGTTVYFVLMSSRPEYNEKIKTAHLLAPVAFMGNMKTVLAKYTRRFIGRPNQLTRMFDTMEILPSTLFFKNIYDIYCMKDPKLAYMCKNLFTLYNGELGRDSNMNMTVSDRMNETHPAGASSTQVLHYMQEYESGRFCQLDFGQKENLKKYGQSTPPDYNLANIDPDGLHFYYSDEDQLASEIDVEYLAAQLSKEPNMFHVPDPTFTHSDFVWSNHVKEMINDRIINACNLYEQS
ncbi:lipase 3-like [Teleopsis dalmanni]|uniref:lipase 3-like n=1 Tax=Teleopsis dalmanni TaxID=139649 RepID=UPI0018CF59E6|nr:lipase 3-like [Teleopsis dalmanni]